MLGERGFKKLKNRKTKVASWYFDLNMILDYWGCFGPKRFYHHTGMVSNWYVSSLLFYVEMHMLKHGSTRQYKLHEHRRTQLAVPAPIKTGNALPYASLGRVQIVWRLRAIKRVYASLHVCDI